MNQPKKDQTIISNYHEYILEAIYSLWHGLNLFQKIKKENADFIPSEESLVAQMASRYTFLMIANSIEAAANALLLSLNLGQNVYIELEKVNTLLKFNLFCQFLNKTLDQGDAKYNHIKEIINCRNEFVHPKPSWVSYSIEPITQEIKYDIKETGSRKYPMYFSEIKPKHALTCNRHYLI